MASAASEKQRVAMKLRMLEQCERDKKHFYNHQDDFTLNKLLDVVHMRNPETVYEDIRGDLIPVFLIDLKDWKGRPTSLDRPYSLKVTIGNDNLSELYNVLKHSQAVSVHMRVKQGYANWANDLSTFMGVVSVAQIPLLVDVFDLTSSPSPLEVLKLVARLRGETPLIFPATPKMLSWGSDKAVWAMILNSHLLITKESCTKQMKGMVKTFPLKSLIVSSASSDGKVISLTDTYDRLNEVYKFISDVKGLEGDDIIRSTAASAVKLLKKMNSVCGDYLNTVDGPVEEEEETAEDEYAEKDDAPHLDDTGYVEGESQSYAEYSDEEVEYVREDSRIVDNQPYFLLDDIATLLQAMNNMEEDTVQVEQPSGRTEKKREPIKLDVTSDGHFRDRNGRPRDSMGRYCKESDYQNSTHSTRMESPAVISAAKSTSLANISGLPDGYTVDKNGRVHDCMGRFCKDPRESSTPLTSTPVKEKAPPAHVEVSPIKTSTTSASRSTPAPPSTPVREVTPQPTRNCLQPGGQYKDGNGRWHGADGKFCKDPTIPEVVYQPPPRPVTPPQPRRVSPPPRRVSPPPRRVSPVRPPPVQRSTRSDGAFQDANGRWHGANGRFCTAPSPERSFFSAYSQPSYSSNGGGSSYGGSYGGFGGGGGGGSSMSGYSQDRNGRWHGPNGRFCKNPWG